MIRHVYYICNIQLSDYNINHTIVCSYERRIEPLNFMQNSSKNNNKSH